MHENVIHMTYLLFIGLFDGLDFEFYQRKIHQLNYNDLFKHLR